MKKERDEKIKKGLIITLFVLMMGDFLTTFIGVGFLGLIEGNLIPRIIISVFGFWLFFVAIIFAFFILIYLGEINYKLAMRDKNLYFTRFLIFILLISLYSLTVFNNTMNIIYVLK